MVFIVHLCNHHTSYKVVVGLGSQLCTPLEVWVLGVGMSCRQLARKWSVLVLYVSHLHIFLLPHISDREFGLVLDLYERES